ncbi:LAGLIDADG family homing endonuclease [Ruegeria hyattellae]|uniref:LAGLIDADG family homing endonuclease n=1 Tax=Ruegeria hyattellae TaxID=3233337 RepID=UPI00355B8C74
MTGLDSEVFKSGEWFGSIKYQPGKTTKQLLSALYDAFMGMDYHFIVNPCIPADTWIETDVGPRVVSELMGKPFKAMINGVAHDAPKGFFQTGVKPLFRLKTARGYEVRATADHRVLVETGRKQKFGGGYNVATEWREVKDLVKGDLVVLNHVSVQDTLPETKRFDLGWLLGEMVGDGCYNPNKYTGLVRFWGDHGQAMADRAVDIIKTHLSPRSDFTGHKQQKLLRNWTVASSELSELAKHHVLPKTKEGTPFLEKQHPDFLRGFLRGLFDADGCVQGNTEKGVSVRLSQTSLSRLKQVQRMLLRFGIASTIYENRRKAGKRELPDGKGGSKFYACKAQHELAISKGQIEAYRVVVGFYHPEHIEKLDAVLTGRKRTLYQDRFTAKVESVSEDGVEPVYDCKVEGIHRFAANGLIVHNCG